MTLLLLLSYYTAFRYSDEIIMTTEITKTILHTFLIPTGGCALLASICYGASKVNEGVKIEDYLSMAYVISSALHVFSKKVKKILVVIGLSVSIIAMISLGIVTTITLTGIGIFLNLK